MAASTTAAAITLAGFTLTWRLGVSRALPLNAGFHNGEVDSEDIELIAQEVSAIGERVSRVENMIAALLGRMGDIEKVNGQLEGAALTTARALQEISAHWDSVYEAMRRSEEVEDDDRTDAAGD